MLFVCLVCGVGSKLLDFYLMEQKDKKEDSPELIQTWDTTLLCVPEAT